MTNAPANHGKTWTEVEVKQLADAYDAQTPIPELATSHQRSVGAIEARLMKLGKLAPDQLTTFNPVSK